MKEKQKKVKNLYNFDYESKEEKKLRERKLKEKKLKEEELKQKALKNKKSKADEKKSASKKGKDFNTNKENGQADTRKKYDDEIIIGVTKVPKKSTPKNNREQKNDVQKVKNKNRVNIQDSNAPKMKTKNKKIVANNKDIKNHIDNSYIIDEQETEVKNRKSKKIIKVIKFLLLILVIVAAITFAMLSPIFNLKNIEIIGNNEITKEEIISLAGIKLDENIFKINNIKVIKNIKQNAYVNNATVNKKLPDTLSIEIQERNPSFILEYGNGYVYINNQGYMLKISSTKINVPILEGISTSKESYKEGNRLDEEDLTKLGTVIKIMSLAQNNNISELITKIDIHDVGNYTLYFESEKKIAYLGDCSNLETRMLYLVGILEREKNHSGEIFINMNLNTDYAYFRESV